jgi:hypothetical protein
MYSKCILDIEKTRYETVIEIGSITMRLLGTLVHCMSSKYQHDILYGSIS